MAETDDLSVLQIAVTIARSEQVRSVSALEYRLAALGFSGQQIANAVNAWAAYYARRHYQP
ncbi:hypothetical protein [Caulobacter sp. UC70_42]|uniref:hypothetical protein n=1 Tax=Caulobacter sp. UC70_42 TaxID=3374551 RepID=UPI003758446A